MKIITKSLIYNVQPELKKNSEVKLKAPTSSPAIANTLVMRNLSAFQQLRRNKFSLKTAPKSSNRVGIPLGRLTFKKIGSNPASETEINQQT